MLPGHVFCQIDQHAQEVNSVVLPHHDGRQGKITDSADGSGLGFQPSQPVTNGVILFFMVFFWRKCMDLVFLFSRGKIQQITCPSILTQHLGEFPVSFHEERMWGSLVNSNKKEIQKRLGYGIYQDFLFYFILALSLEKRVVFQPNENREF